MEAIRRELDLGWGTVSVLEWPASAARGSDTASASPRPDVVLLHGGGVDSAELSWGEIGPRLAAIGYRVFAPDHPGFGESAPPPWPVTQERFVRYVAEVLAALGVDRPVLGGLSFGGGLTLGLALARPQLLRGIVLLGSYGIAERVTAGRSSSLVQWLTWGLQRTGALGAMSRSLGRNRRALAWSMRHNTLRNPAALTDELLESVVAEARRPNAFEVFSAWQASEIGPRQLRTTYLDRLGSLTLPSLLVHGEQDAGVPVAAARRAAAAIPNARLVVVPKAGHWVQRDRPDAVLAALGAFLDDMLEREGDD